MSQCLAVSREVLTKSSFWPELKRNDSGVIESVIGLSRQQIQEFVKIVESNKVFGERKGESGLEMQPEMQQPILYCLLTQGGKVFTYQRGGSGSNYTEKRLSSKTSIGIGVHIEPFDGGLMDSLTREIREEVRFLDENGNPVDASEFPLDILGLVKYDGTEVDSVHVGLVCRLKLREGVKVELDTEENETGEMMDLPTYRNKVENGDLTPEHWTRLIVRDLGDKITQ